MRTDSISVEFTILLKIACLVDLRETFTYSGCLPQSFCKSLLTGGCVWGSWLKPGQAQVNVVWSLHHQPLACDCNGWLVQLGCMVSRFSFDLENIRDASLPPERLVFCGSGYLYSLKPITKEHLHIASVIRSAVLIGKAPCYWFF